MRKIRHAATTLALGLIFAACGSAVVDSLPPDRASPAANPSIGPSPVPAASPADATQDVIDAALATMAEGTFRYDVEVRSADPNDSRPAVSGHGQVSFSEPVQFRFASAGTSEVIYDGEQGFIRGRDVEHLPADSWLVFDLGPDVIQQVRDAFIRNYGSAALVLVPPLGATEAIAGDTETIRGLTACKFVTEVDISKAGEHVPAAVRLALDSQLAVFEYRGTPLTHELEVWIDENGVVVRTRYRQDVAPSDAIIVTYDLSDFGAPMDAAPPAGAEVLTVVQARERYQATLESPPPVP